MHSVLESVPLLNSFTIIPCRRMRAICSIRSSARARSRSLIKIQLKLTFKLEKKIDSKWQRMRSDHLESGVRTNRLMDWFECTRAHSPFEIKVIIMIICNEQFLISLFYYVFASRDRGTAERRSVSVWEIQFSYLKIPSISCVYAEAQPFRIQSNGTLIRPFAAQWDLFA